MTEQAPREHPAEGAFYGKVELHGRTFLLYYGYYEACDRNNPLCEPEVIYPDFTREPVYTDRGEPFVTLMQDACGRYRGSAARTPDTTCDECHHLQRGRDRFGICTCPENRKPSDRCKSRRKKEPPHEQNRA